MMAGVEKTNVLLHVVPTCRHVASAILQGLAFRSWNSGFQRTRTEFEGREAWSRIVTAMQFAAYRLHERVLEPNDFLRWGYVFQVIVALKFYKKLFHFLSMQSCTSVHEF